MTEIEVKSELEYIKNEFSILMAHFNESKPDLNYISERYSELKRRVKVRLTDLEKVEKSGKLSEVERSILLPAFREISLHCNARVGSKNSQELSSSIYDGEDYCSYWLAELNV
jgi:DNA anti-recombination protein RmuC